MGRRSGVSAAQTHVGRVKTALVFGEGAAEVAVVATIVARRRQGASRAPIAVSGTSTFKPSLVRHLANDVTPIVERIARSLIPTSQAVAFDLQVANLSVAATGGVGLDIEGFSADAAFLLAMLSSCLRLPLPSDIVVSGHVGSADGDLRAVGAMAAKVAAVEREVTRPTFICAALDSDQSLKALAPEECARARAAMAAARGTMRIVEVRNVRELLQAAINDEAVVLAALRTGFFNGTASTACSHESQLDECLPLLSDDHEGRFWRALEQYLYARDKVRARQLLQGRLRLQVRRGAYPRDFGSKLLQLVRSLPPAIRHARAFFPLLSVGECVEVSRFAGDRDHEDVPSLLAASAGKITDRPEGVHSDHGARSDAASVAAVLDELSAHTLARDIALPIDGARATYPLASAVTESTEELLDIVTGFYVALLRQTGSICATAAEPTNRDAAIKLLERAFSDLGGPRGAFAEARDGLHGGLRFILDRMTEQYKRDRVGEHVNRVIREAVDALDWDGRVAFVSGLLDHIGPALPPDLRDVPSAYFLEHIDLLLRAYAQSLDRMIVLLRAL
jgi:hypothetical protein